MYDATRRDYVLDRAQSEGRIAASSRAHWSARYDVDPPGTEAILACLAPVPVGAGVLGYGDPVVETLAAGRALVRGEKGGVLATLDAGPPSRAEQTPLATDPVLTSDQVEAWTRDLFPETRAGAGARKGRITSDGQYTRGAA